MAVEKRRGCGFRKVGGLYLVGIGVRGHCDRLPFFLEPCPTCGFKIPFTRNFLWLSKQYLAKDLPGLWEHQNEVCTCEKSCPICYPLTQSQERFGFMWVGKKYYTPSTFIKEALEMNVCKKIPNIPTKLKLGETWILLAHPEVPTFEKVEDEMFEKVPETKPAIFFAFRPSRVEKLIWESEATEETLKELEEQGITPVIIPDGDEDHAPGKQKQKRKSRNSKSKMKRIFQNVPEYMNPTSGIGSWCEEGEG